MHIIQSSVLRSNRVSLLLNIIFGLFLSGLTFIVGYVPAILWWNKYALLISAIWTFGLIGIGMIIGLKGLYNEWRTFELPWEINSVGSYVANRELMKVTGMAFVISEIIMASSMAFCRSIRCVYKMKLLSDANFDDIYKIVSQLQDFANNGRRFVALSEVDSLNKAIIPLLVNDVIWYKKENNEFKIGINRVYDNVKMG